MNENQSVHIESAGSKTSNNGPLKNGSVVSPDGALALVGYLEFLPGVYPVTNGLTLSIYYYNRKPKITGLNGVGRVDWRLDN